MKSIVIPPPFGANASPPRNRLCVGNCAGRAACRTTIRPSERRSLMPPSKANLRNDPLELSPDGPSAGISKNTVNRLWQLHNLKPHLSRTFKLSRDPKFLEKLTDVVGLYSIRRKRRWSCAWTRKARFKPWTAPNRVALKEGRCGTMTHDTSATGQRPCLPLERARWQGPRSVRARHRHQEFLKFLRRLDKEFPEELPCIW